jgi:hypothetical protein
MKKFARAVLSFVAALAVAIPVLSFTLAGTAGASTPTTYTATQSITPPSASFVGFPIKSRHPLSQSLGMAERMSPWQPEESSPSNSKPRPPIA